MCPRLTRPPSLWLGDSSRLSGRPAAESGVTPDFLRFLLQSYPVMSARSSSHAALLIVGHGSTVNAASSAPTRAHMHEIRRRRIFTEVQCAFWKEEPSLRDALLFFADDVIREVFVVPNFISEGYFTETVIPRELELEGPITRRANGQIWKYCEPAGSHSAVTELLLARAKEVAPGLEPTETALIIVAHGTELNENSAIAAKREAERIRARKQFASVLNAYMEEPPLIADWDKLTSAQNVIAIPFFISDGLHSYEDIPRLLGIAAQKGDTFQKSSHNVRGRRLWYGSAIGTDSRFADIIVEQALNPSSVSACRSKR
jgi:sirohydrochlorin cobaltochelatase